MKSFSWLCAFLSLMAGPANPLNTAAEQSQPTFTSSTLWFSAIVAHSDLLENAFSYRLYDEPQQLLIVIAIGHQSPEPLSTDQEAFARQLRLALRDDEGTPVAVETDGTFWRFTDAGRVQLVAGEPLQIVSGRRIEWALRVRRADGQRFATGRQTIDLSLAGPFSTLRLPDGSTPRSLSATAALTIQLGAPRNAHERGRMHALLAQEAYQERRYADAAAAAQLAVDADPLQAGAYTVLGGALLQLDRCREATEALENVLRVGLIGRTSIPRLLAQAYVCIGDKVKAKRILRVAGDSEAQLDAEIASLQELIDRRRRQNPGQER